MTSKLTITTNNHKRDLLYWHDLTDKERAEFDWIDQDEADNFEFFRYKNWTFCLSDFMRIEGHDDSAFSAWDGYTNDSFFSGTLIKWPIEEWGDIDAESIIVGWYFC